MLRMAVVFLIIALIAAFMGFGLVADFSYTAAKVLFFVFLVLAILSLIGGAVRRPLDEGAAPSVRAFSSKHEEPCFFVGSVSSRA